MRKSEENVKETSVMVSTNPLSSLEKDMFPKSSEWMSILNQQNRHCDSLSLSLSPPPPSPSPSPSPSPYLSFTHKTLSHLLKL